jgi:hypothetical protein
MTKKAIWTIGVLIILVSCKKEKFLDRDDLKGSWIEQTNNSIKNKLIFEEETLYFIKPNTADTLSHRLDRKRDLLYLTQSAGESNHKLLLNKKSKLFSVWGLFPSIPEQVTETKFKKE